MLRSLSLKITLCSLLCLSLGGLGGWITSSSVSTWFPTLQHPPLRPPNWIFGPVWSILYLMIGASFALIWHHRPRLLGRNPLTFWFTLQLVLNLAWTPVFFGVHQLTLALGVIIALWLAISQTMRCFAPHSKPAALLLLPYLLWVSFAAYLNAAYAWLN